MEKCVFCDSKIINSQKIYETGKTFVTYNIRKANKGRCLIIPKSHVQNIRELTKQELNDFFLTVQTVSKILNEYLKPSGFNYGFNEGADAGQTVSHFHFHILPRFKDDPHLKYHLFHGNPRTKCNWKDTELVGFVSEFRSVFEEIQ